MSTEKSLRDAVPNSLVGSIVVASWTGLTAVYNRFKVGEERLTWQRVGGSDEVPRSTIGTHTATLSRTCCLVL